MVKALFDYLSARIITKTYCVRYKLSGRKFDHWKQQIENGRRKFQ